MSPNDLPKVIPIQVQCQRLRSSSLQIDSIAIFIQQLIILLRSPGWILSELSTGYFASESMASVTVPDTENEKLFTLIKGYSACKDDLQIVRDYSTSNVEFQATDGRKLTGSIAAARFVASLGSRSDQLLGNSIADRSKISEVLSLTRGMARDGLDEQLEVFNDWLKSRTFLVGHSITLADLVLYAALSKPVTSLPVAQHAHFSNILRWYENLHYMVDRDSIFPDVSFVKTPFSFVPAPVVSKQPSEANEKVTEKKSNTGDSKKQEKKSDEAAKEKKNASKDAAAAKNSKPPKKEKAGPKEDPTVDFLDIRVGIIKSIGPHPNADALYVEEIDLGEEKPRTVVSGLRKFVSEADMKDRKVAVVCNLKPAKMRDIMSYGMVLCASNADHTKVDPILIPEGSTVGSRILCEGFTRDPEAQINPKKKIFEQIAPDLLTSKGTMQIIRHLVF
jgi:aminoacyl tRNA synthase complex-interacting multifunctional protein 1